MCLRVIINLLLYSVAPRRFIPRLVIYIYKNIRDIRTPFFADLSDSRRVLVQYNTNRGCRAWVKPTLSHISTVKSINFWLLNDLEPRRCRRPSPRPRLRIDGVQYRGSGAESTDMPGGMMRFCFVFFLPPHYFFSPATAQGRMPSASSAYLCFTNH